MSKINDLIKKLCPNGVEYLELYKIIKWNKRFSGISKDWQKELLKTYSNVSAQELKKLEVKTGDIKLLSTGIFDGYTDRNTYKGMIDNEEVITIPSGGTANIKYYSGEFINSGNILGASLNSNTYYLKYIYYCLLNKKDLIQRYFRGSSVQHPDMRQIIQIKIPVPPIEIQKEIARILDKFGELEAELEARKQQYEFWRGKLFEIKEAKEIRLDELFNLKNGFTPSKSNNEFWENGTIPWFRMEDIRENGRILNDSIQHVTVEATKGNIMPANSIIVSTSATIGEHALITCKSLSNQRFTYLVLKDEYKNFVDMKYIFYHCFLLNKYCLGNLNLGNFASIDMNAFRKYIFKIPSLDKQKKIVNILDRFDDLTYNITIGLPAEIELRRKQYEYYRNKLLSFEELIVNE